MDKKILIILIIVLILALTALAYSYINKNINKKEVIKNEAAKPQTNFSYVSSQRPTGSGDEEGYFFPDTYKIQSQNWEGDKLKIVVTASGNLCAQKQGSYAVEGDKITLTVREELQTSCNGIGYFDYTFLTGPIARKDYKVFLTFGGGY